MRLILYIFILAISFLLMTLYDLYGAFLFALVLILVPLLSILFGWWGKRGVALSAPAAFSAVRGETAEVPVDVTGKALPFLPRLAVTAAGREAVSYEERGTALRFFLEEDAPHVGRIQLPAPRLSWTDPFGFFHFHKEGQPLPLLVLPKHIGNPEATWHTLTSLMSAEEREHFGATLYTPGDNPRLINWKVTARKDELYVRDSYPAEASRLALACDYDPRDDVRDLLCDVLYAAGLALVEHREPFRFVWADKKGGPVVSLVHDRTSWEEAIKAFLIRGGAGALERAALPADLSVLYLTGETTPHVAPTLRPTIWCGVDNPRAALSGKAALLAAVGGAR